ncbi:TonB-dependent receptor domain-containing protein [Aliarcobacter butzleri]|uniref:TonB-dependent receptor domain-containing protein n=1 Tax=Aliarcobacter butzleri TaxID=28197 RepID=UPI00214CAF94|nr:TonB-dependent receptor [Aliarcobacter butzleri]MCP3650072.1 TonB-dependent receptor [Arcobacter sp. DNRA7]MCR1816245.1 TonB-dependent receptor [Aliarcobacter butzleri]
MKKIKIAKSLAILLVTGTHYLSANETTTLDEVQVVTSATGYEQNVADAPATISVITAEELEKKSYSDITDALKNVPGVYVNGGGTNQTISIRGMASSYTLFLIDGKPMNDGQLLTTNGGVSGANVSFLPPLEAIERIEVIRGPASALYGSDAMGGVINIITKKHSDKATASIRTEYIKADSSNKVNNDSQNTSIYANAPLIDKLLSLQITGGYQTIDESSLQKNNTESAESDPEYKKQNIGGKLVFTPDENNTIIGGYSYSIQERTHTPGLSMLPTATRSHSELTKDTYNLSHEAKYDKFLVNSYAQYDKDKNSSIAGRAVGGITNPGGIEFETTTLNSQGTYFFDTNSLSIGANYKKENLEDGTTNQNASMAGKVTKMDRYQWALFAEDTWNLTDDLALTLSGRFDKNEQYGSEFSPKAYAVYSLTDNLNLKGGVIKGYKAPSLRNSAPEYMLNSMGGALIPNPDLEPEKSWTYEAGVAYDNPDIGLGGSLMLFQTDFKDKITRTANITGSKINGSQFYIDNPNLPYNSYGYTRQFNVDKAEIKGIELTTDYYILENLKYRHSYTFTDSEQKSGANEGNPLNDISKHMFNAGLDWDVTSKFLLWTQANYRGETSGTSTDEDDKTPSYTFVDLGTVYKYDKKLQFSAGIYNIANKNVLDDGNSNVLDGRRYSVAMNLKF